MNQCRICGSTDRVTVHRLVDARYPISEFIPEGSENLPVDPACFVFDHVVDIPVCDDCIGRRTARRRLLAAALALGYSYFVIGAWVSRGADKHGAWCLLVPVFAGFSYILEHRSAPGIARDAILRKQYAAPKGHLAFTMSEWEKTPHS
jgi:hypothetical protein